jgi:hypothetical protein
MDGFSGYNQIQIHPADQYKTAFTTPWGTFAYRVMPFGLKNAGTTFQWAMTYIFHDLAHIILAYLDDLTARSKKCTQHLDDLRIIFQRCRQYNIRLNPLKCMCLRHCQGASSDSSFPKVVLPWTPSKSKPSQKFHPPEFTQLQSLQGKANFLRRLCHSSTRFPSLTTPRGHAQKAFDDLKMALG